MVDRIDREEGRGLFGADPVAYTAARPPYPAWIFSTLARDAGLGPGCALLEIGPGPGTATAALLEAGADPIVLLEPDERFQKPLQQLLAAHAVSGLLRRETLEAAELSAGGFDLVVAATSFHWLNPDSALQKIRRLLKPGGTVALFWNVLQVLDWPDPFHDATAALLKPLAASPSGAADTLPFALDEPARRRDATAAGFQQVSYRESRWRHELDSTGVAALYAGFSSIARLPEVERVRLLDAVVAIAERDFAGRVVRNVTSCLYLLR